MLFWFCVALWFILWGASSFKVFPCSVSSCFDIDFNTVISSTGEKGAGLCAYHVFVCCVPVSFFHFFFFFVLLVLGVGCGLWLWHSLDFSINFFVNARSIYTFLWMPRKPVFGDVRLLKNQKSLLASVFNISWSYYFGGVYYVYSARWKRTAYSVSILFAYKINGFSLSTDYQLHCSWCCAVWRP